MNEVNSDILHLALITIAASLAILGIVAILIYRMMKREYDEMYAELTPVANSTYCPDCFCEKCIKERTIDSSELEF